MYKEYQYIKTSTSGNRTGFIIGKDAQREKEFVMRTIQKKLNLEAEQYAFCWEENSRVVMNMAGNELCGGAILASSILNGVTTGRTGVYTVGNEFPLESFISSDNTYISSSRMPISIVKCAPTRRYSDTLGCNGFYVELDGIAYFVTDNALKFDLGKEFFVKLDLELGSESVPCLGIIQVINGDEIIPTVWVKSVNSITAELGCTTGTISTQLSFPRKDGTWKQPSGMSIEVQKKDGYLSLAAEVELLSQGVIMLKD